MKLLLLAGLLVVAAGGGDTPELSSPVSVELSGAEGNVPDGWEALTFPKISKHTRYALVDEGGSIALRAESDGSASGLVHKIDVDPTTHPSLRWRWRVENVLQKGDVTRKEGDDYPARIYILFEPDPSKLSFSRRLAYKAASLVYGELPTHTLSYIWASRARRGEIYDNPYTSRVKMVVVESGPERVGQWVEEERSIAEDYRRAFGEDPPAIRGIGIMTDTDNTGESAIAYYGEIRFMPAPPQG